MSDIMKSIPFGQLMEWILAEHKETGQVFGIQKAYVADPSKTVEIFGRKLENPVGPAAGPHTQLAQNLVAAYYAGARFFELKTVQKMDGPELSACIPKPCIVAEDEAYNCEWSTELYVPQAMEEYIKGWMILHVIAKEFGLGSPDGFQFNMSCGYNLEGIQDKKIDDFIEGMKDAGDTELTHYEEVRRIYRKKFDEDPLYKVVPYEGIKEMLKELKKRGMRLAVCSNKPHVAAVKVIEKMFDGYFDFVIGQSDSIRRKPAPDGPLKAASEFGVSPSECMYVGDTKTDMETGTAAKMHTVGVLWGFRDREELESNGAEKVAEKPQDLLYICEEWKND